MSESDCQPTAGARGATESLFHALRRDIDRMLCALGLSQDDVRLTHLGNDLGGHDAEPNQETQCELLDGDEDECGAASVPILRPQSGDEPCGRRVLPLDAVPLVRLAQRAEGDVGDGGYVCDECGEPGDGHKPGCAWSRIEGGHR